MTSKPYLNPAVLDAIDPRQFQAQQPFPWINPQYFIQPERYPELLQSMLFVKRGVVVKRDFHGYGGF